VALKAIVVQAIALVPLLQHDVLVVPLLFFGKYYKILPPFIST
jgi:hypothetical protein